LPSQQNQRLYFLDWVRIIAFFVLIFYHVGMYYVTWDWSVKSEFKSDTIEPLMMLSSPWRLSLLFMISGVASCFMLNKLKLARFAALRSWRLLIPLLFGMAVIVPPQSYFEVVEKVNYAGSYSDFLNLYYHAFKGFCDPKDASKCLILPTWNHLWFVAYLWVYSMLLWGLAKFAPQCLEKMRAGLQGWMHGWLIVILPVMYLALVRVVLYGDFPSTNALLGDWFNHANYLFLFLFGVLIATSQTFWQEVSDLRWQCLAFALSGWVFMFWYTHHYTDSIQPSNAILYFQRIWYVFLAWNAILAVCGFAYRHLNFDHSLRPYLTEAVFPVYILHQTLTIVMAHSFKPWHLHPLAEGLLLVGLTFGLSFIGFEIIRRVSLLRPLFGLSAIAKPVFVSPKFVTE
ncbi:MAG: acyltransferase family protein, partial [Undibacterium sp.]|nr:acyltransferase family protein [Undibacterium sp.]